MNPENPAASGTTTVQIGKWLALLGCSAIALSVVVPSAAFAQDQADQTAVPDAEDQSAASADTSSADDIIVTAQRRSERAVDVPASLTIVSGEDLERGGAVTTLDLTTLAPGLKMDRAGTNTYPSIRGVTSLVSGPGFDANVATYIDGVYSSNPTAILDLPDVESLVVLKGPQGTLFGRNATGGAIQITTRKPEFTTTGKATIGYGRFNDIVASGFISMPLVDDKLAISVAGLYETRDGYLHDDINNKMVGDLETHLVRGKLLFVPTDNVEVLLSGYWSYHRDDNFAYGTAFNGSSQANLQPGAITPSQPYHIAGNIPGFHDVKSYGFDGRLKINTSVGDVNVIGAYNNYKARTFTSAYGGFTANGGYQLYVYQNDESYSFETTFTSKRMGMLDFILGYYYYHDEAGYDPLQIDIVVSNVQRSLFGYQGAEAHSGFGEANLHLTDRLTATAGIRYSSEKRDLQAQTALIRTLTPPGANIAFGEETFGSWTPKFSLRYEIADNTNIYATYSKGFKSGGFDTTSALGRTSATTPSVIAPVKPETLTAYEIGFKTSPNRVINFSIAGYYYDYTDQQVSAYVALPPTNIVVATTFNAASSEIYGIDAAASFQISDEFNFHSGLSLIHARFTDFKNAVILVPNGLNGNVQLNGQDVTGNRVPRTPDVTVSAGVAYERQFDAGTLRAKADLFFSDESFYEVGNTFKQPAYENLDASLSWTLPNDRVTFTAWGRNLTDAVTTVGTNIGTRAAYYYWAPPRTYGVSASVKF